MSSDTAVETKWTKGPWVAERTEPSGKFLIRTTDNPYVLATVYSFRPFPARDNARLIAASPDLYEALADMRARFHAAAVMSGTDPEYADIACEKADAALAKARGEAS